MANVGLLVDTAIATQYVPQVNIGGYGKRCITRFSKTLHAIGYSGTHSGTHTEYISGDSGVTWSSLYTNIINCNSYHDAPSQCISTYKDGFFLTCFQGSITLPYPWDACGHAPVFTKRSNEGTWETPVCAGTRKGWAGTYTYTPTGIPTGTWGTYWSINNFRFPNALQTVVDSNGILHAFFSTAISGSTARYIYWMKFDEEDQDFEEPVKIVDSADWPTGGSFVVDVDFEGNTHLIWEGSSGGTLTARSHKYYNGSSWSTKTDIPNYGGSIAVAGRIFTLCNQVSRRFHLLTRDDPGRIGQMLYEWDPDSGWIRTNGVPGPYKGSWSSATTYSQYDVVDYGASSGTYRALRANVNKTPNSNPSDWELVVSWWTNVQHIPYPAGISQNLEGDMFVLFFNPGSPQTMRAYKQAYGTNHWVLSDPIISSVDTSLLNINNHIVPFPQQTFPAFEQLPYGSNAVAFLYCQYDGHFRYGASVIEFSTSLKRSKFNATFDTEQSMWDACQSIGQIARAVPVWKGSKLSIVIDRATTPTQLFNVGNIIQDSFKMQYLTLEDRAAEIEVNFVNSLKDYEKDTIVVINDTLNPVNKINLNLKGINTPDQAWREANYRLLCNQYLLRTIEFSVNTEALAANVGDVVRIQHDVPEYGEGGRVLQNSDSTSVIYLDKAVTIDSTSSSYEILVRYKDDTVDTRTVVNPGLGTWDTLTVSTPFSQLPKRFDLWTFGVIGYSTRDFRITEISRDKNNVAKISAVEYRDEIYDADAGFPTSFDTYVTPTTTVAVTDLSVTESAPINEAGTYTRNLIVNFNVSDQGNYSLATIYYKKDTDGGWTEAGSTKGLNYLITNVDPTSTYQVKVVATNKLGTQSPPTNPVYSPMVTTVTTATPTYPPSPVNNILKKVSGLQIKDQENDQEWTGKDITLTWYNLNVVGSDYPAGYEPFAGYVPVTSTLKEYEVIVRNIDGTLRRIEYVTGNSYTYTLEMNTIDGISREVDFYVTGIDINGRRSIQPAYIRVDNLVPEAPSNFTAISSGSLIIVNYDPSTELDSSGYRIWVDSTSSFDISDINLKFDGTNTQVIIPESAGTYYVKGGNYDVFGKNNLNISPEIEVVIS